MAIPIIRHEDSRERWVAIKDDAEHVVGLTLVPIITGPNRHDGWNVRILIRSSNFDSDSLISSEREQWIERAKFTSIFIGIVRTTNAEAHLELQIITENLSEVAAPDKDPHIPSVVSIWAGNNWHERETYDMFGIIFDGHPALTRIFMPDDWNGHPQRKDYPLGGIPVEYKGATVPPPSDRRVYR